MNDIFKKAVEEDTPAIYFENFYKPESTWQDVMEYIYKASDTPSSFNQNNEEKDVHKVEIIGSLKIQRGIYLIPLARDLHKVFKEASGLMEKITGSDKVNSCKYYDGEYNQFPCDCGSIWHIQGLRFSATPIVINHHKDPCDVLYWQMLGTSYWTINREKEYKLNPGDMLYINKNATHGIRQDGPRVAILIDGLKPGYGKDDI